MLYKEFGPSCYEKQAPVYKTYQTENGKETLLVSKNYNILKQSKSKWENLLISEVDWKFLALVNIIISISILSKSLKLYVKVGDGATSVVVKACKNKNINETVAIKKVKRVFEHTAFAHRAMRELRILRCLGPHDNVRKVHLIIIIVFE